MTASSSRQRGFRDGLRAWTLSARRAQPRLLDRCEDYAPRMWRRCRSDPRCRYEKRPGRGCIPDRPGEVLSDAADAALDDFLEHAYDDPHAFGNAVALASVTMDDFGRLGHDFGRLVNWLAQHPSVVTELEALALSEDAAKRRAGIWTALRPHMKKARGFLYMPAVEYAQ